MNINFLADDVIILVQAINIHDVYRLDSWCHRRSSWRRVFYIVFIDCRLQR